MNSGNGRGDIIIPLSSLYDEDFFFFFGKDLFLQRTNSVKTLMKIEGIRAID